MRKRYRQMFADSDTQRELIPGNSNRWMGRWITFILTTWNARHLNSQHITTLDRDPMLPSITAGLPLASVYFLEPAFELLDMNYVRAHDV